MNSTTIKLSNYNVDLVEPNHWHKIHNAITYPTTRTTRIKSQTFKNYTNRIQQLQDSPHVSSLQALRVAAWRRPTACPRARRHPRCCKPSPTPDHAPALPATLRAAANLALRLPSRPRRRRPSTVSRAPPASPHTAPAPLAGEES
jgi:hypothetical protein